MDESRQIERKESKLERFENGAEHDPETGEVEEDPSSNEAAQNTAPIEDEDPPDPKLVTEWADYITRQIVAIGKCGRLPDLDKIEGKIKANIPEIARYVGAEKALALTEAVEKRRGELSGVE